MKEKKKKKRKAGSESHYHCRDKNLHTLTKRLKLCLFSTAREMCLSTEDVPSLRGTDPST